MQAYLRELRAHFADKIAMAAFAWLAATVDEIPQWSGASAATFTHLANEVGYPISITQAPLAPNREGLGRRSSKGEVRITEGRATFTYSTTLAHLIFNEFNNANVVRDPNVFSRLLKPGPYQFQAKGKAAFLRVAATVRLPNPFHFLKVTKIKVG